MCFLLMVLFFIMSGSGHNPLAEIFGLWSILIHIVLSVIFFILGLVINKQAEKHHIKAELNHLNS